MNKQSSSQGFKVQGTKIIGPDGNEFIMKGTNVNGYKCWWPRETTQDVDLIVDAWNFNTVRVNCVMNPEFFYQGGDGKDTNNDTKKIVETFTSRGIVVMLEIHDWTGKYPTPEQLELLTDWWVKWAHEYKDNPYVWFNIVNEAGKRSDPQWLVLHETVTKAIREAGINNVIVCDGATWGQDNGRTADELVTEEDSAILAYGPELLKYDNMVFSVHMYGGWNYGKRKFEDYVEKVLGKGMALIIGEFGISTGQDGPPFNLTVRNALEVSREKGIGWLNWAWDGGDGNKMTQASRGGGWEIDKTDGSKPTNLSWFGDKIWDDAHGLLPDFSSITQEK